MNSTDVLILSAADADLPAQNVTISIGGNGPNDSLFQIVVIPLSCVGAPDFETPFNQDGVELPGALGGTVAANDTMERSLSETNAPDYDLVEIGTAITKGDTATIG